MPNVQAYAVETQGSVLGGGSSGQHKVEGIGSSFIPKNFDASVCDAVLMVKDPEAFGMVKELAAKEGVLAGSSGGANVFASLQVAARLERQTRSHPHSRFRRTLSVEENLRRRNLKKDIQHSALSQTRLGLTENACCLNAEC